MRGEYAASEAIAGPRCLHDMIAAWCSWCRGLSEDGITFDLYEPALSGLMADPPEPSTPDLYLVPDLPDEPAPWELA